MTYNGKLTLEELYVFLKQLNNRVNIQSTKELVASDDDFE